MPNACPSSSSEPADFFDANPLKSLLGIPEDALDQAMGIAFQLYNAGRYTEAEIVCRGLLASDHRYWWPHSLLAAVLRRTGRYAEALGAVERGLRHEPYQPKLLLMRAELNAALSSNRPRGRSASSPAVPVARLAAAI